MIFQRKWLAVLLSLLLAIPLQWLGLVKPAEAAGYPDSCQAVKTANPYAPDGEYFILVSGKPVQLYCADMSTTPKEYISLVNTGGTYNFSRYAAGGSRPGTDVTTTFTKVRFHPTTLVIDTTDLTFSTSTGSIPDYSINTMWFGMAADCMSPNSFTGTGNVNLIGTPFAVAAGEFVKNGYSAAGTAEYSDGSQVVNLSGGGFCGSNDSGSDLKLELKGPTFDLSTSSTYGGQATLAITYPLGASQQKFRIDGGYEQSYGGTFLIDGSHIITAYSYDSGGSKSAVNQISVASTAPDLRVALSESGSFSQGQTGAAYSISVSNVGSAATNGTPVTVKLAVPSGLTVDALAGSGWSCDINTLTCMRTDPLAPGGAYPSFSLTVNVAPNAAATVLTAAEVSGGGEVGISNNSVSRSTTIVKKPDLTLAKTHTGTLWQGKSGVVYTLTVQNKGGAATDGATAVTVTDALPAGLSAVSLSGPGWSCDIDELTCSRTDVLSASGTYPAIQLVVDVSAEAPVSTITNTARVDGGGELYTANNTASDGAMVLNSNAYLSGLILASSSGAGITGFSKTTTSYSSSVEFHETSVTVTPTAEDESATLRYRVNGGMYTGVNSGTATPPLELAAGDNTIDIEVVAENANTTLIYTITVHRSVPGSNADLRDLTLSNGWNEFNGDTGYTMSVSQAVYQLQLTATAADPRATIDVSINEQVFGTVTGGVYSKELSLNTGANIVHVRVTAQDGVSSKLYTLTIYRAMSSGLSLSEHVVSTDGTHIRLLFTETIQIGTVDPSKFLLLADGKSLTVATATYDQLDASGRTVTLYLTDPIVYGQTVTLEILQGAVNSISGEPIPSLPAGPLLNTAEYDEARVVGLLRLELHALDHAQDGIQVNELLTWINSREKDITGDGIFDVKDIRLLLNQLDVRMRSVLS